MGASDGKDSNNNKTTYHKFEIQNAGRGHKS
jgi:hypothetical protein